MTSTFLLPSGEAGSETLPEVFRGGMETLVVRTQNISRTPHNTIPTHSKYAVANK